MMDTKFKLWTAKRKSARVLEIIQGKSTVAEASRSYVIPPSEIEDGVDDGKKGMENALRAKPVEIREQYEKQCPKRKAVSEKQCPHPQIPNADRE